MFVTDPERLSNFRVYATNTRPNPDSPPSYDAADSTECFYFEGTGTAGQVFEGECAPGTEGRYVVVQLMSERDALNLCEVELYGGETFWTTRKFFVGVNIQW